MAISADEIYSKISKGYWPNKGNESAHVEEGNAVVDSLSVGELSLFLKTFDSGPTYVMVRRRCESYPFSFELLDRSRSCSVLIDQFLTEMESLKTKLANSLLRVS